MKYDSNELREMFYTNVSIDVRNALIRVVYNAYEDSYIHCYDNFSNSSHARDLLPDYRRAKVEDSILGVAHRYGLQSNVRKNKALNCSHTTLRMGQVELTINLTESSGSLPRISDFREKYALKSQFDLYQTNEDFFDCRPLYCILTHGVFKVSERLEKNSKYFKQRGLSPDFLNIIIPARDYKSSLVSINLMQEHGDFIKGLAASSTGLIEDHAFPTPHRNVKKDSAI
ncbi:MAG: hypothetical protein KAT46_02015 [Deltaproteobacteria bacterium]|nr:hypothetical protein [Deltaproteobacteria bacterium]